MFNLGFLVINPIINDRPERDCFEPNLGFPNDPTLESEYAFKELPSLCETAKGFAPSLGVENVLILSLSYR
jgi:hypothetical protein